MVDLGRVCTHVYLHICGLQPLSTSLSCGYEFFILNTSVICLIFWTYEYDDVMPFLL